MHGLMNRSIQCFLRDTYGAGCWRSVAQDIGIGADGFEAMLLYDDALTDWRRVETNTFADGARERIEVLWLNPACCAALDARAAGHGTPLFAGGARG